MKGDVDNKKKSGLVKMMKKYQEAPIENHCNGIHMTDEQEIKRQEKKHDKGMKQGFSIPSVDHA